MHLTKLVASVATAAIAGSALAACGATQSTGASSGTKDTIVVGTGATPQTLDPLLASDVQTDFTNAAMYDKLVDYDAEGNLVGRVVSAWTVAPDATSVELTIQDGITFHSGDPLTAADVVYSLDRIKRLNLGVASFISDYASAKATDDTHVTLTLSKPNSTFVGALSKVYVLDSALVEKHLGTDDGQGWLATHDAGSGPYSLASYKPNEQVVFARYDDTWRPLDGRPKTLVYRYVVESATKRDELLSGDIDLADGLTPTDGAALKGKAGITPISLKSMMQTYVMMKTQGSITADPVVREAIQLAYDYEGHVKTIIGGNGTVASGVAAPTVGCRLAGEESKQDVARAKELIQQAGASGKSLTLAYQSTIPEHNQTATLMQSDLKAIGLDVKLKSVTYPEYMKMISDPKTTPDLAVLWDFPYYPQIGPMLYRVYDSTFIGQTNYALYDNAAVDKDLAAGLATGDADAACADFTAAQKQILADRVSVNISNPTRVEYVRDGIGGPTFTPTAQIFDPTTLTLK